MKKKLGQWVKSEVNSEEEDSQQRFDFLKLMGFKVEIKQSKSSKNKAKQQQKIDLALKTEAYEQFHNSTLDLVS